MKAISKDGRVCLQSNFPDQESLKLKKEEKNLQEELEQWLWIMVFFWAR